MAKNLYEYDQNLGTDSEGEDFSRRMHVFGHPSVAEGLVAWSEKNDTGTKLDRDTPWGLKMTSIARRNNPRVVLSLEVRRLQDFLSTFGPLTNFHVVEYGIALAGPGRNQPGGTLGKFSEMVIYIPAENDEDAIVLMEYDPLEYADDPNQTICLGAVDLGEEGFTFITVQDMQGELGMQEEQQEETVLEASEPTADLDIMALLKEDVVLSNEA